MEKMNYRTLLMILFAFSLVITASELAAQVYKVVDKDGNVTFTDRPPADDAIPMDLPPISVIETPDYGATPGAANNDPAVDAEGEEVSLRSLRNTYRGFAIVSPQQEDSLWGPDGPVSIVWSAPAALKEGMQVTISLNGNKQKPTTDRMIVVTDLPRGEFIISAVLTDSRNRTIATAAPVTFFVRQPGLGLGLGTDVRNRNGARSQVGG